MIYIKNDLIYKTRNDLFVSDINTESLTIEIINKVSKYIIVSYCYKPPSGITQNLSEQLNKIFQHVKIKINYISS